jgi:hypothetical protein
MIIVIATEMGTSDLTSMEEIFANISREHVWKLCVLQQTPKLDKTKMSVVRTTPF